jgi:hypothetical protein
MCFAETKLTEIILKSRVTAIIYDCYQMFIYLILFFDLPKITSPHATWGDVPNTMLIHQPKQYRAQCPIQILFVNLTGNGQLTLLQLIRAVE